MIVGHILDSDFESAFREVLYALNETRLFRQKRADYAGGVELIEQQSPEKQRHVDYPARVYPRRVAQACNQSFELFERKNSMQEVASLLYVCTVFFSLQNLALEFRFAVVHYLRNFSLRCMVIR